MKGSCITRLSSILLLAAFAASAASQAVEFDGRDAQQWAHALTDDPDAAIERLVTGGEASVPMLRALFADERQGVQEGVALAGLRIGAPALPIGPELVALLRTSKIYSTRERAARALAAIGDRRPEVFEALLDEMLAPEPDEAFLQLGGAAPWLQPFAAALQVLDSDATIRVLQAIDADRATSPGHAARVVDLLDDTAVPTLIAALDARQRDTGETARLAARESLRHRGWRVARRLERAGFAELAEQALHAGITRGLDWLELYDVAEQPAVPLARLPEVRWLTATSRADTLTLWRAAERPQGFAVERLLVTVPKRGEPTVTATGTVVSRALANDAMRAIGKVLSSSLTLRERHITGMSLDRCCWSMRVTSGDATLLDQTFVGSATSENLPERFPIEATALVLDDLLRDAVWQPREPDDADRQHLRAVLEGKVRAPWVVKRLHALADLLGVEHD